MKIITRILAVALPIGLGLAGYYLLTMLALSTAPPTEEKNTPQKTPKDELALSKAQQARLYELLKQGKPGRSLVLFVDYRKPSYQKRLFVLDSSCLDSSGRFVRYLHRGYAAHGEGGTSTEARPTFSNTPDSWCSSYGAFRVAEFYTTSKGDPAFRLDGLDESNSNIRRRGIVLHPRIEVDYYERHIPKDRYIPHGIRISQGCVVTTHAYFELIKAYIDQSYSVHGLIDG
ncbi:MAG: murein L,D-transpeptidase catalytic domain family protein [Porphyromonas sp.]|nr:murein L,D-transpeptidase catalytic domain family protein [Porphyromonas sp.]